jgi:hypothetical protein
MKIYARIQDGCVAELLKTDGEIANMFHRELIWVDVSANPEVAAGWRFDGMNVTPPSPRPSLSGAVGPTIADLQAQLAAIGAQLAALSNNGRE